MPRMKLLACVISTSLAVLWLPCTESLAQDAPSPSDIPALQTATPEQTQAFKQLIYDAIAAHPTVRGAFARSGQAKADEDAAKAALRPQLDLEVQGQASLANDFGNSFNNLVNQAQSRDNASASLVARQLLFDGGAASGHLHAAGFAAQSADANAETDISRFALSAVTAYCDIARYRMLRDLADGNVLRHQKLLEDIRARTEQGVGNARDVARGEARLADARAQLLGADRQLEAARNAYVEIFGMPPADVALPIPPISGKPDLRAVQDAALAHSPLLAAARSQADAQGAEYRSAKAEHYIPSLSVELRGTRYNIGQAGPDYDVSAILAVNYSLYGGGLKSAREKRALQQLRETQYNVEATRRQIVQRVQTAGQQLTSLTEQLSLLKMAAEANARSRDIFLEQYSVAGGNVLDVLQAEQDYVSAAGNYINGAVDQAEAAYNLLAETGQLLPEFNFYLANDGIDEQSRK